jgi:hypothetical protein
LGEGLYFSKATEPTNIIWENRYLTPRQRFTRALKVSGIILILILISFTIIFVCKKFSSAYSEKYPAVDCPTLDSVYGSNLEKWAAHEFENSNNG